jgi:excisionase family DNA binding protein
MVMHDIIEINGKRFVTVSALSQMLRLHKRTVQLWATEHTMPLIRVGNLMIFDLDDITEWLNEHKYKKAA